MNHDTKQSLIPTNSDQTYCLCKGRLFYVSKNRGDNFVNISTKSKPNSKILQPVYQGPIIIWVRIRKKGGLKSRDTLPLRQRPSLLFGGKIYYIPLRASYCILHTILKKRKKSSFSSNHPGAIHTILQSSYCKKQMRQEIE